MIVDSHAHLADPSFDADREDVIQRAVDVGIAAIVIVSETLTDAVRSLELASLHPILRPAAGLYPTVLDMDQAEGMMDLIRTERKRIFAIGEVGLDHWAIKEEADRDMQRRIFLRFIRLAQELGLPLNVHSRSAGKAAIRLLLEIGAQSVQLHAFDGKWGSALDAVDAGYYFSIPPSVVRSRQKQKLVKQMPLDAILLETDSPVLGPTPNERNEPSNILSVVDAISEIKRVKREKVVEAAYENTVRLYGNRLVS
jgi:TatD DNase family protein